MRITYVENYEEIKGYTIDRYEQNNFLYRGTYKALVPSIIEKCSFKSYSDLEVKEHLIFNDFKQYFCDMPKIDPKDNGKDWEIRIAAREYGLASSLMDWTNNLDIAIEFAIHNFESKNIEFTNIWMFDKTCQSLGEQLIITEKGVLGFNDVTEPSFVQDPNYKFELHHSRRLTQGGFFLKQLYQDIAKPMNENKLFSDSLTRFVIPKYSVPNFWNYLINKPKDLSKDVLIKNHSLDNICSGLNEKYK